MFLDTVEVVTDASGNADFSVDLSPVALASAVAATATNDSGKTSEFSTCVIVTPEPSPLLLDALACAGLATLTRRRRR